MKLDGGKYCETVSICKISCLTVLYSKQLERGKAK